MTFWNRLLVVMEKDLYVQLLEAEEATGTPKTVLVREAIREYVQRYAQTKQPQSQPAGKSARSQSARTTTNPDPA